MPTSINNTLESNKLKLKTNFVLFFSPKLKSLTFLLSSPPFTCLLSRQFDHTHSYKSKDNPSRIVVRNTLRIKTKLPRSS